MGPIKFRARLVAPYFTEMPPEIGSEWLNGIKKSAPKTYQGIKKAIKTQKDFKEKMAQPTEKTIASFIDPNFVSKHGLTRDNILNKAHKSLDHAAKGYFQAMEKTFQDGRYEKKCGTRTQE
jgi:hypothetical protein